jgi:biotin operon repressor
MTSVDQLTATEYPNMSTQNKIIAALNLNGRMSTEQLALQLNLSTSAIQKNAKELIETGAVVRPAKGFYELPAPKAKKAKTEKAPKADVPAYDGDVVKQPARGELSKWIREQIAAGVEVPTIVAHGTARFPSLQVTTGLVNWLDKKMTQVDPAE